MPAFYIGKKSTNSVLAPIINLTQVWETEKEQRVPSTPKFMQDICIKMNASFTRSPTTKRYFRYFSVCVGASFPGQRHNSVCLNRAFLGMLTRFERYHMATVGDQTREVTLFLKLGNFLDCQKQRLTSFRNVLGR